MESMEDHFYEWLPSTSSKHFHPGNNASKFKVKLQAPRIFSGKWEVGLSEISIPRSWFNVRHGQNMFTVMVPDSKIINFGSVVAGRYSIKNLIAMIHETIDKLDFKIPSTSKVTESINFKYNRWSNKVELRVDKGYIFGFVGLANDAAEILGWRGSHYKPNQVFKGTTDTQSTSHFAPFSARNDRFSHIFIYCNVVAPSTLGGIYSDILRTVPVPVDDSNDIHHSYSNVQYLPVLKPNVEEIEIDLRNNLGEQIPFNDEDETLATLHFRRVRAFLY